MTGKDRFFANRDIRFLDTTLRDGEQTPGVSLSTEDKIMIALSLAELGVDIIEAGSAITSNGEREAIKAVVSALKTKGYGIEVASYCRIKKEDIDFALECDVTSIHLVVPVSDLHIKQRLKKDRKTVLNMAIEMTKYAKSKGLIVEISGEDASRANFEYLKSVYEACIEAGANRICFCDTVGLLVPEKTYEIFKKLANTFDVPIAVHCHDDLGLATANTLAALRAGASQAHVTINGIGERAGNASLEEVVMSLEKLYKYDTGIELKNIYSVSRLVSKSTEIQVAPNKAIVGGNAFTHEAGIHVHGLIADTSTYEPMNPENVGRQRKIMLGKHAGKSSVMLALKELGLNVSNNQLEEITSKIKDLGDKGKYVTDADFEAIVDTVLDIVCKARIKLEELTIVSGTHVTPTSSIILDVDGNKVVEAGVGDGPVDAAITAIKKSIAGVADIRLEEYHVDAITGGTDALVKVIVKLSNNNETITASGAGTDIIMASVEAVIEGINRLLK